MALFSRAGRSPQADPHDAIARAVITPAVLVMLGDGSVDRRELTQLANLCVFSPIFEGHDDARTVALLRSIASDLGDRGANAVMNEAVATLTPALRETALVFAMRIAMADGDLAEVEKQLLMNMSRHMQIADDVADTMFGMVLIMQRPATA